MEMLGQELIQIHDLAFEPYLSAEQIALRVGELGTAIRAEYADRHPIFVSVLNGAFIFAADLVRAAAVDCETAFTRLSSYEGTSSTGVVRSTLGLDVTLAGRHLIVVEDIVDTGRTLHQFLGQLREQGPASLKVVALLVKPEALEFPVDIDFRGFEIPNRFVVGYGLDYNGRGRQLPHLYQKHIE